MCVSDPQTVARLSCIPTTRCIWWSMRELHLYLYQNSTVITTSTIITFRNKNVFGLVAATCPFVWFLFRTDCSSGCKWD
jgi:hypothetical protein